MYEIYYFMKNVPAHPHGNTFVTTHLNIIIAYIDYGNPD